MSLYIHNSIHKGKVIDEQITYTKNIVPTKISNLEGRASTLEINKANKSDIVRSYDDLTNKPIIDNDFPKMYIQNTDPASPKEGDLLICQSKYPKSLITDNPENWTLNANALFDSDGYKVVSAWENSANITVPNVVANEPFTIFIDSIVGSSSFTIINGTYIVSGNETTGYTCQITPSVSGNYTLSFCTMQYLLEVKILKVAVFKNSALGTDLTSLTPKQIINKYCEYDNEMKIYSYNDSELLEWNDAPVSLHVHGQYSDKRNSDTITGLWKFEKGLQVGTNTVLSGYIPIALGNNLTSSSYNFVLGHYNKITTAGSSTGTGGDSLVIGNGTSSTKSNAFRVTYAGATYGLSTFNTTGADYAEFFEWIDQNPNNEDRRGLFVTLEGDKIRIANSSDNYILGIVSSTPAILGDNYADDWQGKYQIDVFGKVLTEEIIVPQNNETGEDEHIAIVPMLNLNYNSEQEYIPREQRKEWSIVGLVGKLIIIDDGTCVVGGYCTSNDLGIGTAAQNGYKVMKRIDETHIQVMIK